MATGRLAHEEFLRGFVLPLVCGGELHVGKPLGAAELSRVIAEAVAPGETLEAIEQARRARAAAIWLYPVNSGWDPTAARLAVAAHNLLFLSHPDAAGWSSRRAKLERVAAFTAGLLDLPAPKDGAELVARHTIVGNLLDLTRIDVELDTWAMVYRFHGMEPPARLKRWPSLRRVRERREVIRWAEEQLGERQLELLAALLRASPLTDLLGPGRSSPEFDWPPLWPYLRWQLVGRLVSQRYLELGLDHVGPPLARAFWRLVGATSAAPGVAVIRGTSKQQGIRTVGQLVAYLYAASAVCGPIEANLSEQPAATLPAVLAAVSACGLWPGPEIVGPEVEERVKKVVADCRERQGAAVDELAGLLRASLE